MSNIEERVVKMQFDNSQFERRVRTTINSLHDLKKASNLKGAAAGMEELQRVANAFSLAKISKGVESLQKRFSTFGIVGMRVIQNVTDSLMNLTKKATSFVTGGILTGGKNRAFNLENAHFQLLGLLKDEQAVSDVMKNVSDSVDGTAYSLDAAATVASQLAASGMRAGDQMFSSLRAVAGVAAMTNSEYSDIGRIFTQVAGQGKLMGDQLLQLSGRGMNAAATLADYLTRVGNGAQVTEAEVREMVSDGQIDFATFAAAMDDAFGEHAKKANETFTGAMSNIRSALGRIGAMFYSPLIVQNGALVQMFNAIRIKINEVKKALEPVAEIVTNRIIKMVEKVTKIIEDFDLQRVIKQIQNAGKETNNLFRTFGGQKIVKGVQDIGSKIKTEIDKFKPLFVSRNTLWDIFEGKLKKAGVSADTFKNKLLEVAKSGDGIRFKQLENLLRVYGNIENVFNSGKLKKNEIVAVIQRLADDADKAARAVDITTESLEHFQAMTVDVIRGNWGNGEERIRRLNEAGENQIVIQKLVNKVWERNGHTWDDCSVSADELTEVVNTLSESELQSIGYTEDQAKILKELAQEAGRTGTPLAKLIDQMKKPTATELIFDAAKNALSGLMTIISSAKTAFKDVFSSFKVTPKQVYNMAQSINEFSKRLIIGEDAADKLTRTFRGVFTVVKMVAGFLQGAGRVAFALLTDGIELAAKIALIFTSRAGDAIVKVDKWGEKNRLFKKLVDKLVTSIHSATKTISEYIDKIEDWAKKNELISNSVDFIRKAIDKGIGTVKDWYKTLSDNTTVQSVFKTIQNGFVDVVKKIPSTVTNLATLIVDTSKDIYDAVSRWTTEFIELPKVQAAIEKFKGYLGKLIDFAKDRFKTAKDNGGKLLDAISNLKNLSFEDVVNNVKKFGNQVADSFDKAATSMTNSKNVMDEMADNTRKMFSKVNDYLGGGKSKLSEFVDFVKSKISEISIDKLFAMVFTVGIYKELQEIGKVLKVISGPVGGLTGVFKSVSGLFKEMTETVKQKRQASVFRDIANSIAIIAGSIAVLAVIPADRLKTAATVLGIMSGIMISVGLLLSVLEKFKVFKVSDMESFTSITKPLIAMAASLWILGKSMEILTSIDWTNINSMLSVGVVVALEGFLTLFSMISGAKLTGASSNSLSLVSLSGSVYLLARSLEKISKLDLTKETLVKTGRIVGMIELLALISKKASKSMGAGIGMLGMVGSIYVLALAMTKIGKIDTDALSKNMEALAYVFGIMTGLALDARLAGGNAHKAGAGILLMATSLIIISQAMNLISGIDSRGIDKSMEVIVTVFSMFAVVTASSKLAGDNSTKAGTMTIKMAVAMGIISAALIALSMIDQKDLRKTEEVIGVIGVVFAAIIAVSKIGGTKVSGTIIALSTAIAGIGGIMIALSMIDRDALRGAEEAIVMIGLVMSALLIVTSKMSSGGIGKIIVTIIAMTAALGLVSIMLTALSKIDADSNLKNATALSEILLAISAAMAILQLVPIEGAFKVIGDLAIFFGGSVGILYVAGLIGKSAYLKGSIEKGIEVIKLIGEGIGSFVAGLSEGLLSGLPGIGRHLSDFMDNIQGFLNGCKQIDNSVITGVKNLSEAVLMLSAASFIDGITSFLTGSWITGDNNALAKFGSSLSEFGKSLSEYSESVKNVDKTAIDNSSAASKSLIEVLTEIPKIGGLAGAVFGNREWDTMSSGLAAFGISMKAYSQIVADMNVEAVQNSVPAGKALSDLLSGLSPAGGLVQSVFGSKSWPTLTTGLVPFGRVLKAYASIVEDMNIEAVQNSVQAGQALSDLLGTLQNAGGLVQSVFGSKSWSTLTTGLGTLGDALVSYSGKVVNINLEAITNSVSAANTIKMVLDTLNVMKDKTVEDICYNIGLMGGYLNTYGQNISSIDTEQMHNVSEKLRELGQVVNYINSVNYDNLEGFGSAIKNFAKSGITKFVDFTSTDQATVTEYGKKIVKAMISGITSMKTGSDKSARDIITSFMNTMSNTINATRGRVTSTLTQALSSICTQGANKVRSFNGIYYQAGRNLGLQLANGIRTTIGISSSAVAAACSSAAITARGYYGSFYSAGVYVASGFAAGITANTYAAQARAAAMASAAASAARRALQIASPSKVFYSIGNFAGMGLVNALIAWSSKAFSAGEQMAKSAMEGVQGLGDLLSSIIAEDVDVAPTITPVIDLTNVTSGLATMDSMFGARQISLNSDTSNRLGSGIQTLNQNGITIGKVGDNSDVVSSIRNLTDRVDKLGASMTRMQVVLDTGATVGAIAPSMDRQLGRMEAYKERGI